MAMLAGIAIPVGLLIFTLFSPFSISEEYSPLPAVLLRKHVCIPDTDFIDFHWPSMKPALLLAQFFMYKILPLLRMIFSQSPQELVDFGYCVNPGKGCLQQQLSHVFWSALSNLGNVW